MHRKIIPGLIAAEAPVPAIGLAEPVRLAAERMATIGVSALAVLDDSDRLAGIVTESDLVRRVLAQGLDPAATAIEEVMTGDPDVLAPTDTALDAFTLMRARGVRHLPVAGADRVPLGVLALDDLTAALHAAVDAELAARQSDVFEP
jgi:signal-transduction protein with cAMP-binding, CBS, and nucleotidyltransferase domain